MKSQLEQLVLDALDHLPQGLLSEAPAPETVVVERTRDAKHGDFATNVALRLSKIANCSPRELAEAIVAALPPNPLIARATVAGAGFINFFVAADAYARELVSVHELRERYGHSGIGRGERIKIEIICANPNEPPQMREGRQAAYEAALANILGATGFAVARKYDGNDAHRQTHIEEEVGADTCRFFYLMRGVDFDLELAKTRTNDNPAYFVQYAHARVASVMKELQARGRSFEPETGLSQLGLLVGPQERATFSCLARYPEALEQAAVTRAPQVLILYLRELASALHTYHNSEQFIVNDAKLRNARLALVLGVQQVLRNGLTLLGVSAPESM